MLKMMAANRTDCTRILPMQAVRLTRKETETRFASLIDSNDGVTLELAAFVFQK